ncbi:MAG: hypothetical protein GXX99_01090 [Clostridiales bacterium]|nr:hypothetical protein [Clostridiales bacterium]
MIKTWTGRLLPALLLCLLALCALAAEEPFEGQDYPSLAPPAAAGLVQRNAYTPTPEERGIYAEDLAGRVAYVSEAVIKLMPETEELISLDYRNVDLRELVARLSKLAGRHALFFGEPVKVTVKANVVTPMRALDEALRAAEGMKYLVDEDVILVGPEEMLTSTFVYTDVATTKPLRYLSAEMLERLCETMELRYTSLEPAPDGVRLVAMPHDLAHILMVIESLDVADGFVNLDTKPELILERLELRYITGKQFVNLAERFGIRSGICCDHTDAREVYLSGNSKTIADLRHIAEVFDVALNEKLTAKGSTIIAQPYRFSVAEPEAVAQAVADCGISFRILCMSDGRKVVYAVGNAVETRQAVKLMSKLDREDAVLVVLGGAGSTKTLTTLRDKIVKETSLKVAAFTVTENLGASGDYYYLYCVAPQKQAEEVLPYRMEG